MGNRRNYYRHDEDRPQRGYRDREAENERYFGGGMNFGEGYDPDDDDRRSFSGRGRSSASRRRYEYGGERPRFERDRAYGDYDKPGYPQDEPPYRATRSSYYDPATGTRYDVGPSRYGGRYPESEAGFDHDDHERGWWERTADEVSSWFGDEAAARRRRMDARNETHRGRGPRNYTRSDERITEDINDHLTDFPYLDASDIEVSVSSGEVTLTGNAESRYDKRLAEDLAHEVLGVKNVENRIRIESPNAAVLTDTELNEKRRAHRSGSI